MLIERYFDALEERLEAIRSQVGQIQKAAQMCANALVNGGALHIYDSGHMVSNELVHRAGGLVAMSPLTFGLNVTNPVKTRSELPSKDNANRYQTLPISFGYIEHVFHTNQLRAGDVLFIGSVSGKTANVIELALQAKDHELTVIAITATAYSSKLESEHPSGKRLFEVSDLTLDNHAPYGDAMLAVEELDYPICPASGIGAAVTLWAVTAGIVEEMTRRGLKPTVYPSVNRPDGRALVSQVENEALRKGF